MQAGMNPVFAKALEGAKKKFGESHVHAADSLNESMFGVSCPTAWGWVIGGSDKVPIRRVIGCDGKSGSYKSFLFMEHSRWWLRDGGLVAIDDTEEKTSDTMICGTLFREPPELRCNYAYVKATSVEQAEEVITYFRHVAKEQVATNHDPEQRAPWLIIWDSLTGRDTKEAQAKIVKEGSAAVRAFAEAASSIARYYKNLSFGDELFTLAHVQHVSKNMDDKAMGDDKLTPKGGDEPRYASTYHFRVLRTKDIQSAEWQGKELTVKMIKSSLGPDKRKLDVRVLWKYVWIDAPIFSGTWDGGDRKIELTDMPMSFEEAQTYYDWTQQCLPGRDALLLREVLKLDAKPKKAKEGEEPPPHCKWPNTERIRFQQTWWDWDWALGNLLVHGIKYKEKQYAQEKKDLDETLFFVKGTNNNSVKCKELWGDEEFRTLEEFGRDIQANEEIHSKIKAFLGITHYKHFREVRIPKKPKK